MVLTPRLDQRQTQSLVMTPQLQQAIKLLQMSNLELTDYITQELERNPLLEREDTDQDNPSPETGAAAAEGSADGNPASADANQAETATESIDAADDRDWTGANDAPSLPALGGGGGGGGFDGDLPDAAENLTRAETLREHLLAQIGLEIADPADRLIGIHLVEMVDEAGYLSGDPASVAERMDCPVDRVLDVLARLQQFDPPGVLARSLAECLALQLKSKDRLDPAMRALLDHLDLLAKRDFAQLSKLCGVDAEDIADMIAEIKVLDPKPGLAFDAAPATPVVPDVLMRPQPGGGWIVELNPDTLPRVLINNAYHARISGAARTKEERHYIAEQMHSASWLVKSLHQRATTILKVATELVRQQEMFFRHGVAHLRPLVLRDIATVIDMHESTVSRVTSNKYMATPRGIYELKYFFSTALAASGDGINHSAESVRHRIKALIDAEAPDAVLSDDQLVDILKAEGVAIARRTVAKYREGLHIPSSVQRRREKA